jgi:hypothetical protein
MKYPELKELFKRVSEYAQLDTRWFNESWEHRGPVSMVPTIATNLWLLQSIETKDTELFREQIHHLETKGCWYIEE